MIYDLIILGGGPAGYVAGERAGEAGKSVLLIEKDSLGGVCLNEGCIPTKTLLVSAKMKDHAVNGKKYGVEVSDVALNHKKVMARKNKTIKKLVAGVKMKLEHYNVEVVKGEGYILDKNKDRISIKAGEETYTCKNLLVATGSSSIIIPIDGMDAAMESSFAITNTEVLQLKEIPERMVIIGGGVIGLEIATYFSIAGSKVTVIEMLEKIAGSVDDEISEILQKECEKKGIEFILGARVNKIAEGSVEYEKSGENNIIECDRALLSVGRRANTTNIGLENLNIEVKKGICVDERMMTTVDNVYAAGDVTAKSMLAHTAYRQAEVAVNNMFYAQDSMKYNAIPAVIYTDPEVASVGLTKAQADAEGLDTVEQSISMNYSGRYMAENEAGQGIAKIIVEKSSKRLLGVHIVGTYASEIIYGVGIMIEQGFTIDDIKRQIFPHPTVAEIIREAAFMIEI